MNYSLFEEIKYWNKESIKYFGRPVFEDYEFENDNKLTKIKNLCEIGPGGSPQFEGIGRSKSIKVEKKNCVITVTNDAITIVGKNYTLSYDYSTDSISFQLINKNGLYEYSVFDGTLMYYDQEALRYAKKQGNTSPITSKMMKDLGINPDKTFLVRGMNKNPEYKRSFNTDELLRLFELLKNNVDNTELRDILNASKEGKTISYIKQIDQRRLNDEKKDSFPLNTNFIVNAHVLEKDEDDLEQMVIEVKSRTSSSRMYFFIYSYEGLGSVVKSYTDISDGTLKLFNLPPGSNSLYNDGKTFESAYQELLKNILGRDTEALESLDLVNLDDVVIKYDHRYHEVFTKNNIQKIISNLNSILPAECIETISSKKENIGKDYLITEIEEIERRNGIRELSNRHLEDALLIFRERLEAIKNKRRRPK